MEKKILAILCIIAFVILYILPVIIAGIILTGIFMGCFTFYKKHPNASSHAIYMIITPLLILGWCYIGYYIYSNDYCNTYEVRLFYIDHDDGYNRYERKKYTIVARAQEDVYVKIWRDFISENKKEIKSIEDFYHYERVLYIWNQSKKRSCYPDQYEKIDSLIEAEKLYYRIGEMKLDLLYLSRGW